MAYRTVRTVLYLVPTRLWRSVVTDLPPEKRTSSERNRPRSTNTTHRATPNRATSYHCNDLVCQYRSQHSTTRPARGNHPKSRLAGIEPTSCQNRVSLVLTCVCYKMLYLFIDVAKPVTLKCFPTYFDVRESISRLGCCPFADMRPYLRHKSAIYIGLNPNR